MSSKKRARAQLVYVEWRDAASVTARWQDRQAAIKAGLYYSGNPIVACGFLIAERKKTIVLALTYNHHNDDVSHVMAIPRAAISTITRLRGARGAKKPGSIG